MISLQIKARFAEKMQQPGPAIGYWLPGKALTACQLMGLKVFSYISPDITIRL